jgi:Ni2+-binding GTPase involved in maturation of urease and hydrogenase
MKTLHVNILGTTGVGKTTLAQAIESLCKQHGVDVSVSDGTDGDYDKQRSLANLAGKVSVAVMTTQVCRKSL